MEKVKKFDDINYHESYPCVHRDWHGEWTPKGYLYTVSIQKEGYTFADGTRVKEFYTKGDAVKAVNGIIKS